MSDLELTMMKRVGELKAELTICKAENDRLKAEVERLKAVNRIEQRTIQGLQNTPEWAEIARMTACCRELEAEVERLSKAGDMLCFHYISLARKRWPDDPLPPSVTNWNAAKEGKQSVSIKRYSVGMTEETNNQTGFYASFPRVYEDEKGQYVEYADFARLKAELTDCKATADRLEAEVERLTADNEQLQNRCDFLEGKPRA